MPQIDLGKAAKGARTGARVTKVVLGSLVVAHSFVMIVVVLGIQNVFVHTRSVQHGVLGIHRRHVHVQIARESATFQPTAHHREEEHTTPQQFHQRARVERVPRARAARAARVACRR